MKPADFNQYGARRGNHEVMMRGTFCQRASAQSTRAGVEGSVTRYLPSNEQTSIYEASVRVPCRQHAAGDLGRQGVRLGLVA